MKGKYIKGVYRKIVGKIEKHHNFFNTKEEYYRIGYKYGEFGERFIDIKAEDMAEFMDDIMADWMELEKKDKKERFEREHSQAEPSEKKLTATKVITKEENIEQDRDEGVNLGVTESIMEATEDIIENEEK